MKWFRWSWFQQRKSVARQLGRSPSHRTARKSTYVGQLRIRLNSSWSTNTNSSENDWKWLKMTDQISIDGISLTFCCQSRLILPEILRHNRFKECFYEKIISMKKELDNWCATTKCKLLKVSANQIHIEARQAWQVYEVISACESPHVQPIAEPSRSNISLLFPLVISSSAVVIHPNHDDIFPLPFDKLYRSPVWA